MVLSPTGTSKPHEKIKRSRKRKRFFDPQYSSRDKIPECLLPRTVPLQTRFVPKIGGLWGRVAITRGKSCLSGMALGANFVPKIWGTEQGTVFKSANWPLLTGRESFSETFCQRLRHRRKLWMVLNQQRTKREIGHKLVWPKKSAQISLRLVFRHRM